MSDHIYHFTGKVIPERATVSFPPATFAVSGGTDVPQSSLFIQIILSQVFVRLTCPTPILNALTARNIVADCARSMLDAGGFVYGRGYDVDINQYIPPNPNEIYVFGVDISVLEGRATTGGLTTHHLLHLMSTPYSQYFRRALGDFRASFKNPTDTAFFCYRAIETLMQQHAATLPEMNNGAKWAAFRTHFGIEEAHIREIKKFADPVRHGSGLQVNEMTDAVRARVFELAWDIGIKVFLRAFADAEQPPADGT